LIASYSMEPVVDNKIISYLVINKNGPERFLTNGLYIDINIICYLVIIAVRENFQ